MSTRAQWRRLYLMSGMCMLALLLAGCAGAAGKKAGKDAGFDVAGDRPPSPKTLYTMARILVSQHREAVAESLLKQAVAAAAAYLPAFVALAELQLKQRGGADAALATLDRALAIAPRDATLHNDRGMCFVSKKEYAAALDAFTKSVELEPETARFRGNRAMALGMLGEYDECLAAYATVVSPAEAHYNLAVLCRLRGDMERAQSERTVAESLRTAEPGSVAPGDGTSAMPRG
jgi:tetratricopeptide (TPR) repeat protein